LIWYKQDMRKMNLLILSLILCASVAFADDTTHTTPAESQRQWGISGGVNRYTESLMQLSGPEVGLHARWSGLEQLPRWQLEGDVLLGLQRYTSQDSGSMRHVGNIETRWRGLYPVYATGQGDEGWSAGLALHTLWNDLRGKTTTHNVGYEREALHLWLPLRWTGANAWTWEGAVLLRGRHTSRLSEVRSTYTDVHNTQKSGVYLQASTRFDLKGGTSLNPFVRLTRLGDSDSAPMGGSNWVEPKSQRWQIGAVWQFSPN
jgi:hypothetical protein